MKVFLLSLTFILTLTTLPTGASFFLPASSLLSQQSSSCAFLHQRKRSITTDNEKCIVPSTTTLYQSSENEGNNELNNDNDNNELQVLSFNDPKSNRKIMLIGCMHYNPASISLVKEITTTLGTNQTLHSVLIEMCPTRWNTSNEHFNEILENNPLLYEAYVKIFNDEMTTASNIALYNYNVPVILGDQPIEITMERIKYYFKKTCNDVCNPFNGGWDNMLHDIKKAYRTMLYSFGILPEQQNDKEKNHLTLYNDFLDMRLLTSMPFSLLRYPLSVFISSNGFTMLSIVLTILLWRNAFLLYFPDLLSSSSSSILSTTITTWLNTETTMNFIDNSGDISSTNDIIEDVIGTIGIVTAEIILFLRIFVLPILYERDRAIADMILSVANNENIPSTITTTTSTNVSSDVKNVNNKDADKVIVAVLGMAHCNGVRDLIVNREL